LPFSLFTLRFLMIHIPVLLSEVLHYLDPKPGENFIDATFGFGGHGFAILEKIGPSGKLLGVELDSEIYQSIQPPKRLILVNDSYANLGEIVKEHNFSSVNGILFDLGFSSWHIEQSGRGFSFLRDEPLGLNYGLGDDQITADQIINQWPEQEIAKILKDFGEERFAGRISSFIVAARHQKPINTTFELVEIIRKAIPQRFQHQKIHPATRTFQALRIAVNDELSNLKKGLAAAMEILSPGGRLVVISFHSLEDRIVKHFFRQQTEGPESPRGKEIGNLEILTKKPVCPTDAEIAQNPRSRSAKLRAARLISNCSNYSN